MRSQEKTVGNLGPVPAGGRLDLSKPSISNVTAEQSGVFYSDRPLSKEIAIIWRPEAWPIIGVIRFGEDVLNFT